MTQIYFCVAAGKVASPWSMYMQRARTGNGETQGFFCTFSAHAWINANDKPGILPFSCAWNVPRKEIILSSPL